MFELDGPGLWMCSSLMGLGCGCVRSSRAWVVVLFEFDVPGLWISSCFIGLGSVSDADC